LLTLEAALLFKSKVSTNKLTQYSKNSLFTFGNFINQSNHSISISRFLTRIDKTKSLFLSHGSSFRTQLCILNAILIKIVVSNYE